MNVVFIIAQADVKSRSMLLNQGIFKNKGFFFRIGDNEIKDGAAVLRNMKTKNQVRIEIDKIEEKVPEALNNS